VSQPCYLLVPRCAYLSMLSPTLLDLLVSPHFAFFGEETDLWYEYDGVPLAWHYPVGVLRDMFYALSPLRRGEETLWKITVHTQVYPMDRILPLTSRDAMLHHYTAMLKASDQLRHGSTRRIMQLSPSSQSAMWSALQRLTIPSVTIDSDGDVKNLNLIKEFWHVNKDLVSETPRHLPLRLYMVNTAERERLGRDWSIPIAVQDLFLVNQDPEDSSITLVEILRDSLSIGKDDTMDLSPQTLSRVRTHGIDIPLDLPLAWAAKYLCYADNTLHFVVLI